MMIIFGFFAVSADFCCLSFATDNTDYFTVPLFLLLLFLVIFFIVFVSVVIVVLFLSFGGSSLFVFLN